MRLSWKALVTERRVSGGGSAYGTVAGMLFRTPRSSYTHSHNKVEDQMSTPADPTHTSIGRLNKLALAAIIFAVIAALGFLVAGVAVLAVFSVGAGHVALNQIQLKGERGKGLAIAALAIGYGIATLALISALGYIPSTIQQFSP